MDIKEKDSIIVFVADSPRKLRANCAKEWGAFLDACIKEETILEAKEKGLIKGDSVTMTITNLQFLQLTFKPHYVNEEFLEITGIPTAGEILKDLPDNSSEIIKFLLHRQSKDAFFELFESYSREVFKEFVNEIKAKKIKINETDFKSYFKEKSLGFMKKHIFTFKMKLENSTKYGNYFSIQTTYKEPSTQLEKTIISIAQEIIEETNCTLNMKPTQYLKGGFIPSSQNELTPENEPTVKKLNYAKK